MQKSTAPSLFFAYKHDDSGLQEGDFQTNYGVDVRGGYSTYSDGLRSGERMCGIMLTMTSRPALQLGH